MAALTWQQVANPSFGGSNDLFRTGVNLQNSALSGIGDALANFRAQQAANVDSAVLDRALRVNDADAYQKALTDGTFLAGVNPGQVSPKTMAALGARATELLGQSNTRSGITARDYATGRTMEEDLLADAARGQVAQRLGLSGPLARLSPEQQLAQRRGEVGLVGGQLANEGAAFRNRTQLRDDNAAQVGLTSGVNLLRQSGDSTDALTNLESMNDLQPQEFAEARKYLEGTFGNLYGAPSAAPGGKGGKPGTASGSPYDTTFNFRGTAEPISSQPISSVLKTQEESKTSQGHSPMGAFQINKATLEDFGPRVLGKDWQNQEFTPENQEKIAKAIFDERKGGDLSKTWSTLPNSSPGAYKNFSWDDMRNILSQGEVGQNLPDDPASLRLLSQASQFEVGRRAAQNDTAGITADVERTMGDSRAAPEVVQELIKTSFPSANEADLTTLLTRTMRDNPNMSAAEAGAVIARSAAGASTFNPLSSRFWGTTELGGGVGVDDSVLRANAESFQTGRADYNTQANKMTRDLGSKVSNAQTKFDEAYQNLIQRQARQQSQPGISTERQENALEKATRELQRALSEQRQDPNYRAVR